MRVNRSRRGMRRGLSDVTVLSPHQEGRRERERPSVIPLSLTGCATGIRHSAGSKTDVNGSPAYGGTPILNQDLRDFTKLSRLYSASQFDSSSNGDEKLAKSRVNRKSGQYHILSIFFILNFIICSLVDFVGLMRVK